VQVVHPDSSVFIATLLAVLLLALGAVGLVVTLLADRAVRAALRARPGETPLQPGTGPQPFVTILKPVKGLDEGYAANLLSFITQDYPAFEILVGAASASDPALAVARTLAAAHPKVPLRVIVCPEDGGLNPKVSILKRLSNHASSDFVLISDSNVRVRPDYLAATVRALDGQNVGLVTNPIAGVGEESTGACFEGLHLATYVARALSFAACYLGRACVVGKSMLFRLSDFRRVSGWGSVRDLLAEDYAIGHAFERAGFRVTVSPHVVYNYNHGWQLSRFVNRHMRWGQMRRRTSLPAYLLEPLFNPSALFVLAVLVAATGDALSSTLLGLALGGVGLRLFTDWRLLRRMRPLAPSLGFVLAGVPKDLLVFGLWVAAGFRRSLDWRGRRFLIGAGTRLSPMTSSCPEVVMSAPRG
jgi:ceramide glucosyltransferase